MVVLVLVLVWVAALLPIALRKRSEWEITASVSRFRYRTGLLRRAYPRLAAAASAPESSAQLRARPPVPGRPKLAERRARRRRVLATLLGATFGTFLLGAIPALRPLWALSLVSLGATAAYVALLAHFARLELEAATRDRKVVPITARRAAPALEATRVAAVGHAAVDVPARPAFVLVEAPS